MPSPDVWDWPAFAIVKKTLPNGLRVILAETHTVPLVFLSWTSQAGFESDSPGLEGLASLTPLLLREGTVHRSGDRITEELEDLGIEVAAGSHWESAFLNLGLLSCDLAAGVELLLDMACAARFHPAAVARLRRRRLAELQRRQRDLRGLANDAFAHAVFGPTMYGRSPLGTRATVQRIDAVDVSAFHKAHYGPGTSYLVVAGSFDSASALDLLGSFELPPAHPGGPFLAVAPASEPLGGAWLVDVPHATESEIRVGCAGLARDSDHLPALEVLDAILGGGPTSRLARRLRQQDGVTYHVRSRCAARRMGGTFVVETSATTEAAGAALAGIRREIQTLQEELVPAAEVDRARQCLFAAELRRFHDLIGVGAKLGRVALHDDPVHYFEHRRQAIARVAPETVREVARRYLAPERRVEVVAGPAEALPSEFSSGSQRWQPVSLESESES